MKGTEERMDLIGMGMHLYVPVQAAAVLGLCMIQDIRERVVSVGKIILFLLASIILSWQWQTGIGESLSGLAVGGIFILLSIVTRERLGMGDALMIACIGWSFGAWEQFQILFLAFAGSSIYGSYLLLQKKDRCTEFAFIPFLFISYLCILFFHEIKYAGLFCGFG